MQRLISIRLRLAISIVSLHLVCDSIAAESSPQLDSIDAAKALMVGTWTYTGKPLESKGSAGSQLYWLKLVLHPDGTAERYLTSPSSDDWGQPKREKWEVFTAKYEDSGQRYYATKIGLGTLVVVGRDSLRYVVRVDPIKTATELLSPGFSWDVLLERGDKNPFSK